MPNLSEIKHVFVVMMENRSFDHMLGYLSVPPFNRTEVDGLRADPDWVARFTNHDAGRAISPFLSTNPYTMPDDFDPPHERSNIAAQMDPRQDSIYPMNGFAAAIPPSVSTDPEVRKLVMSYFGADQVPINHFFAKHFTICDRWFCSLPAGTQPNRLMAMSGISTIDVNQKPLPEQYLVYDWLNEHGVSWRVYHQGMPFFALMLKWLPAILFDDEHFRAFDELETDLINTPPSKLPRVIFVEPTYEDAPHVGFSTDDHAPSGVSNGQEFLMQVYNALIAPPVWKNSLTIVTYDEHGGFFDHVSPPGIPTLAPQGARYTTAFKTLGVRVPACVISPFVKAGGICRDLLDHTSVLKLLGEMFGNGHYSPEVDGRPVGNLSHMLEFSAPQLDPPAPPALNEYLQERPAKPPGVTRPAKDTALQQGFADAVEAMKLQGVGTSHPKFGPLLT